MKMALPRLTSGVRLKAALTGVLGAPFEGLEGHLVHLNDVGELTTDVLELPLLLLVADLRQELVVEEGADNLHISESADHTYRVEELSGRLLVLRVVGQVVLDGRVVLQLRRISGCVLHLPEARAS